MSQFGSKRGRGGDKIKTEKGGGTTTVGGQATSEMEKRQTT